MVLIVADEGASGAPPRSVLDLGLPAGASVDDVINAAKARGITSFRLPGSEVTSSGHVVIPNGSPPVSQSEILQKGWEVVKVTGGTALHDLAGAPGAAASAVGTTVHGATDVLGKYKWLIIGGVALLVYTAVKEAL